MRFPNLLAPAALCAFVVAPALADVSLSIRPESSCATPGETVTAYLELDEAGSEVDGYEVTVRFDRNLLDVVSIQQESLMTDVCRRTWWFHTQTDSTVSISHVLLCGGQAITGPGRLSSITFRASAGLGDSPLLLIDPEFYLAGEIVGPVIVHDGSVTADPDCAGACCLSGAACVVVRREECDLEAGLFLGLDASCDPNPCYPLGTSDPSASNAAALEVSPNPLRGQTSIRFRLPRDGDVSLEIIDAAGRSLRTLLNGARSAGDYTVVWDATDDGGGPVHSGQYFCALRTRDRLERKPITLVR